MFSLLYNVDFEVAAFIFAALLYIETSISYPRQTQKNRIFRKMARLVLITQAFDLMSAFTITYGERVPWYLNILINSGFFMSGLLLCFVFCYYIQNWIIPPGGKPVLPRLNRIFLIIIELSFIPNAFLGFYFSFSADGTYLSGPLYLLMHISSLWFVLCASAALIINRQLLKRAQMVSGVLFIGVYFAAVVLQTFVFPNVLIIMASVSAMLIIAIFSLESPDFVQLQETLSKLTDTQSELERANKKYYNLAYTDLMTGLENRTAYNIRLEQLEDEPDKDRIIFFIADVNELKRLNDSFGHIIGDDAIIKTAKLLKKNFCGCECYRIGGDEFAVISCGDCGDFEDSYRRFVAEAQAESQCSKYPFSIASGYQRTQGGNLLEAMKAADKNMYLDKMSRKK